MSSETSMPRPIFRFAHPDVLAEVIYPALPDRPDRRVQRVGIARVCKNLSCPGFVSFVRYCLILIFPPISLYRVAWLEPRACRASDPQRGVDSIPCGPQLGSVLPAANPRRRSRTELWVPLPSTVVRNDAPSSTAATSPGDRSPSAARKRPLVLLGSLSCEVFSLDADFREP